jgi:hypothetical protein
MQGALEERQEAVELHVMQRALHVHRQLAAEATDEETPFYQGVSSLLRSLDIFLTRCRRREFV